MKVMLFEIQHKCLCWLEQGSAAALEADFGPAFTPEPLIV